MSHHPKKFNEEDKMKDSKPEMNVPLRWLGESEVNPEAVEYANLSNEQTLTDATGTKGVVMVVAEDDPIDPFDQTGPRDEEAIKREIELRRARDRTNTRIGAVGTVVGSHDAVVKASNALKEFMADKEITLIVPDAEKLGRVRTGGSADYLLGTDRLDNCAPRLSMLKVRSPNAEFDGDQIQVTSGMERLRRMQWRTRNPDIATFIKEGRELYEGDVKPIAVLKTNFEDYVLLVNLVRRDIYRNDAFLSAALLIKALYAWGGVARADRKTALRFIKKTYAKCVSGRFRPWFTHAIWEYKDLMIRSMLMDGSKREYLGNRPGMHRRVLSNDIHACQTLTRQCMTGYHLDQ